MPHSFVKCFPLRNTKIFLLDEITSNIDGLTERNIVQTVFRLSQNHTVIMATHRATTIMQMPRIIVICDGKMLLRAHMKNF